VDAAAEAILALGSLTEQVLADPPRRPDAAALDATHGRLNQAVSRIEVLVVEVQRELAHGLSATPDVEPFAHTLRRLRYDLTAIDRAITNPLPPSTLSHLAGAVGDLQRAVSDYLAGSAASVRGRRPPPSLDDLDRSLLGFATRWTGCADRGRCGSWPWTTSSACSAWPSRSSSCAATSPIWPSGSPSMRRSLAAASVPFASSPRAAAAQLRIEEIAERIAEHVESEDSKTDRDAGEHRHPGRLDHVGPARATEHRAPRRSRWRDTEAEKAPPLLPRASRASGTPDQLRP
jgi:hypothetical protein